MKQSPVHTTASLINRPKLHVIIIIIIISIRNTSGGGGGGGGGSSSSSGCSSNKDILVCKVTVPMTRVSLTVGARIYSLDHHIVGTGCRNGHTFLFSR